ncbi:calcium-dependent phosphoinositide phospholipase C [Flavobacterium sp. 270]|uniref:Ca2+-dependent phosphoinositide-specific phospholipase C n=1 Tax=Flavobacterium sp. 270 TaxID=2512114 RepID=UPI001064EA97|nr:Ca2+-dependent phosphoinositide-specific phospholipase C [Flavobacterium sp. 270]TDW52756.1 calcium-dependent phosphoinositide phospholipase C [Flavobacterium sp. 270]
MKTSTSLTFGEISFKASHNSYERNETISDQLDFDPNEPYQSGCMAIELDIIRQSKDYENGEITSGYFKVSHTLGNTTAPHLDEWLGYIFGWHNTNPNHLPIVVYIDIKSSEGGYLDFGDRIDQYLTKYFDKSIIYTPGILYSSQPKENGDTFNDLCSFVVQKGWPQIDQMSGKIIFCLTGNPDWKKTYADSSDLLTNRLCFSDNGAEEEAPPTTGNRIFFNFDIKKKDKWNDMIKKYSTNNLITRVYEVNNPDLWEKALTCTFSAIATNKIRNNKWAYVSNQGHPYLKKLINLPPLPPSQLKSIKNIANNEYRTDHATKMSSDYKKSNCDFYFESQYDGIDIFAIKNKKNNQYFSDHIITMKSEVKSINQKWKLIKVEGKVNQYYIQNLGNLKYMTKRASQLSDNNGSNEIYELEERQL